MKRFLLIVLSAFFLSTVHAAQIQPQSHIIGGDPVDIGALQEVVAVRMTVYGSSGLPRERRCAGTVVASRWVMTAAHCFFSGRLGDNIQDATATETTIFLDHQQISSSVLDPESGIPVSNIFLHPDFAAGSGSYDNDIALIEMAFPVTTDAIALQGGDVVAGEVATVAGWGVTEIGLDGRPTLSPRLSDELQQAELPVVDIETCRAAMGAANVSDNMICAGYPEGGVDSCLGDSGGPLLVKGDQGLVQAGIISFGDGCAKPGRYGVYTRVASYTSWISELTGVTVEPVDARTAQSSEELQPQSQQTVAVQPRSGGGGAFGMASLLVALVRLLPRRRTWRYMKRVKTPV